MPTSLGGRLAAPRPAAIPTSIAPAKARAATNARPQLLQSMLQGKLKSVAAYTELASENNDSTEVRTPHSFRFSPQAALSSASSPSRKARRRSPRVATARLCVITRMVFPSRCSSSRTESTTSVVAVSRFPVGSSHSTRAGRLTRARAIATRCCSPPDSSRGSDASRPESPFDERGGGSAAGHPLTYWPWAQPAQ